MNVGLISHLEHLWEEPGVARMLESMAEFSRLILMDRRGTGLSDPIADGLPVEEELEDITAVLDVVGSEKAALFGHTASGPFMTFYAARHPERVRALVLYAATAVTKADEEAPWAISSEERWERLDRMTENWGTGNNLDFMGPIAAHDPRVREWFGRLERLAASPGAMRTLTANLERTDPRPVMPEVRVPTLVMHRKDDGMMDPRHSLLYAERVPGAKYVELAGGGDDDLPRRHRAGRRRARGVPHRHPPRHRAAAPAPHRPLHRHLRRHRRARRSSGTRAGATCSPRTTRSCGASSTARTGARSRRRATASSPCSTGRRAGR